MVLLVLLLFCSCLGCLREGVWTQYTPADVARWKASAMDEGAILPRPALAPRIARSVAGAAESGARRRKISLYPLLASHDCPARVA